MKRFMFIAALVLSGLAATSAWAMRYPVEPWIPTGCPNTFWSSCVSSYHTGVDGYGPAGTKFFSPVSGRVKEAQTHSRAGGTVIIETTVNGEVVCVIIMHMKMSSIVVRAGDLVTEGQYLGVSGTSAENGGWSPHCHFGIRRGPYVTGLDCNGGWVFQGYASDCAKGHWYDPMIFVPMAKAHARLGGMAKIGHPVTDFTIPCGCWQREYDGGSFGRCMLVWNGTPDQIYLVRTGFYNKYAELGKTCSRLGAPTSNEYWGMDPYNFAGAARQNFRGGYMIWYLDFAWVYDAWGRRIASVSPVTDEATVTPPELSLAISPNPTRASATISFSLPEAGPVNLTVYDLAGRVVSTLADGQQAAGHQSINWNRTSQDGQRARAGVYFVRLMTPTQVLKQRLVIVE